MAKKMNKSFMFNNTIPTGIISSNYIKVDKDQADHILSKKSFTDKVPNSSEIEIMAKHSPFLKYVSDSDLNMIKQDNNDFESLIENNKQKKFSNDNNSIIHKSILRNHMDLENSGNKELENISINKLSSLSRGEVKKIENGLFDMCHNKLYETLQEVFDAVDNVSPINWEDFGLVTGGIRYEEDRTFRIPLINGYGVNCYVYRRQSGKYEPACNVLHPARGSKNASAQNELSQKSREIIKNEKLAKSLKNANKKYDYSPKMATKSSDVDPITKFSKNVRNISEQVNIKQDFDLNKYANYQQLTEEEIDTKAELISTAYNLMKEHNKVKLSEKQDIYDSLQDQSLNDLNKKMNKVSVKSDERIKNFNKLSEVKYSKEDIHNLYSEIMDKQNSKFKVNQENMNETSKEFNKLRTAKIKRRQILDSEKDLSFEQISKKTSVCDNFIKNSSVKTLKKLFKKKS